MKSAALWGEPCRRVGAGCDNRGGPEVLAHLQSGPNRHYLDVRP